MEILQLISSIDEFKGRWQALGAIDRDRLTHQPTYQKIYFTQNSRHPEEIKAKN